MADVATELTIPALLARNRRECGTSPALVSDDRSITHLGLDDTSHQLAARLVGAGVGKGDRVGLLTSNGIEWAATAMAVTRIGAVLVPLSTLLRPLELVAQLRTASVTHLVTVSEYRGRSYVDELESVVPGLAESLVDGGRHHGLPFLRAV